MTTRVLLTSGAVKQARIPALKREVVTVEEVSDPPTLARGLTNLVQLVEELARDRLPQRIDFEDIAVTSVAVRLEHRFGCRVRWHLVDWVPTSTGTAPIFEKTNATTSDVLVLLSGAAGTATIRVEAT